MALARSGGAPAIALISGPASGGLITFSPEPALRGALRPVEWSERPRFIARTATRLHKGMMTVEELHRRCVKFQ